MTDTAFLIRNSTRHRATSQQGRFEYRVWPGSPHAAVSFLHRFWPLTRAERRSDIYLLHPSCDRTLVKLRDGSRLEMKRRDSDVGTVQHWSIPVAAEFPLTAAHLGDLAAGLALRGGPPTTAGLSPAHLVAELDAFGPMVVAQTVQKSRLIFRGRGCRAEICRVSIAGWKGMTIALEATDLTSIATAIDDLRLGTLPNRSYGDALMRFGPWRKRHRRRLSPS